MSFLSLDTLFLRALCLETDSSAMTMVLVVAVFGVFAVFDVVGLVIIEVVGLLFCIDVAREFNPA